MGQEETPPPIEFPPLPAEALPEPSTLGSVVSAAPAETKPPDEDDPDTREEAEPATAPVAVMATIDPDRPRARTLAEAVDGIAMPCDLAPLMGTGRLDPREVSFFTHGPHPATVGSALSDEFERLGYQITPLDDRSIRAERGLDVVEARLISTELTSPDVMRELHPSAPDGALVVEMKLA